MLLAVEEQVFAMLADALLKQTNREKKKQEGGRPIPASVLVFVKGETLNRYPHGGNDCVLQYF